jgi:hypothetical protein
MTGEFEISREFEVDVPARDVWEGITTGTGGWLWPMEYEPRPGGAAPFGGTVAVWDPPHHLTGRVEGENGWFNQLEHVIETRGDGASWVRYVHSGVFTDDWDNQYDGADQHTDFYLHTLRQYLRHFNRRPVTWFSADAPAVSNTPGGFEILRRALGITGDVAQDDTLSVAPPGIEPFDAVVDYLHPNFVGLRTGDTLYRFFGRNAFGAPVGIALHLFGDGVDGDKAELTWRSCLDAVYA